MSVPEFRIVVRRSRRATRKILVASGLTGTHADAILRFADVYRGWQQDGLYIMPSPGAFGRPRYLLAVEENTR